MDLETVQTNVICSHSRKILHCVQNDRRVGEQNKTKRLSCDSLFQLFAKRAEDVLQQCVNSVKDYKMCGVEYVEEIFHIVLTLFARIKKQENQGEE